jgi:hypothetical protein
MGWNSMSMQTGAISVIENTDNAWTIPNDAEAGTYTLRVTINSRSTGVSRSGQLDNAFSVNAPPAADFTLSISPGSQTATAGRSTTFTVSVNPQNGWTAPVSLQVSGLPSDATSDFEPNPVQPGGSSRLSISTSRSTGQFGLVVVGNGEGRQHTTSATLSIQPPEQGQLDFSIDLLVPAKNSYEVGDTPQLWARVLNIGSATIDAYDLEGRFSVVSPSGMVIDAGMGWNSMSMQTGAISVIENTDNAWTIPNDAEAGTYTLRVHIRSRVSGVSRSGDLASAFSIGALEPADFRLSISPTSQVVTQGLSTTFEITVDSLNGWTMPVSLSVNGLPYDATWNLSPNPAVPASTSTLSISTSTSTGQFAIAIVGDAGGRQHTTSATLIVEPSQQPEFDFSISASQSRVTVQRGQAVDACVVTVSLISGTPGRVDLSLSGLPGNVGIYSFSPPYDNPPFTATLSIGTFSGAPAEEYTLTIVASGGGKNRSIALTLTVAAETPSGSFKPYRSSFVAAAVASSIQTSLGYENSLGEDVVVIFVVSIASSGEVVDGPTDRAPDVTSGTVRVTSKSLDAGTYEVSWWAFRASDTSFSNPITWSTSDEIKTVTIEGGGTRSAQILIISTDESQYGVGEDVKITFTIQNTGSTELDLRFVVDIVDPDNNIVYDTHPIGQDKRYPLESGAQASGELTWTIPSDSPCGNYRVEASIRDWNNWDTIFDYRWSDKPGPTFTAGKCSQAFVADHSSFEAWVTLAGNRIFFLLNYRNDLSEDVLIIFFVSDLNGNVFPCTAHPIFGGASTLARSGTAGTVHAASSELRPTTYHVSWEAYMKSDTSYARPIDRSTDSETKVFVSSQGYDAISHTVLYFNGEIAKEYSLNNYALRAYRYHVDPEGANTIIFEYYDTDLSVRTKLLLPTDPERTFTIFIPSEIQVVGTPGISATGNGSAELVKTHVSSRVISNTRYSGTWYEFKITADMTAVAYYEWSARFTFQIRNPATAVSPVYASSATAGEVIADEVLDNAVDKYYEFILSRVTGEALSWFSPYDLAMFVASVTVETLASHQIVILDPIESGQSHEVTIKSRFINHPVLGTQDFTDLRLFVDDLERITPVTLELISGNHVFSAPPIWKTGGTVEWLSLKFDHWEDENGATVSLDASFTYNVGRKLTLLAIYEPDTDTRKTQLFSELDSYFSDTPSEYTGGQVPTKEDIFQLLDEYFEE